MPAITIVIGLLLIVVGAVGYSGVLGSGTEKVSPTALIPAGFGLVLVILGGLGYVAGLRKHVMHLAAVVSLLGIVGALMRPIGKLSKGESLDFTAAPVQSQFAMAGLCAILLILCVRSFVVARQRRAEASRLSQP